MLPLLFNMSHHYLTYLTWLKYMNLLYERAPLQLEGKQVSMLTCETTEKTLK